MPIDAPMTDPQRTTGRSTAEPGGSIGQADASSPDGVQPPRTGDRALAAGDSGAVTFRGRSLEELVGRIRAELGADAIVLRSREGLGGGVGGFFQKRYIEVDARAPLAHELPPGTAVRNDRATTEGLATAGVKALIDQAHPFAAQLAAAQIDTGERFPETGPGADPPPADAPAAAGRGPLVFEEEALLADAGLYGPQPNRAAIEIVGRQRPGPATAGPVSRGAGAVRDPVAPEFERLERRLLAAGLSPELAAELLEEAVDHFVPFGPARPLEQHVRDVLSRRIAVMSDTGPGPRTLALVGGGGAGKTSAAANLVVAYASAGRHVAAIALGGPSGGRDLAARLEPLGIAVHSVDSGADARSVIARLRPLLAVVDVPGDADPYAPGAVCPDLRQLHPDEVHLALPATLSAAATADAYAERAPSGVTHVAVTHADSPVPPGPCVGLALEHELPLSYLCSRAGVLPAAGADVAARLLP